MFSRVCLINVKHRLSQDGRLDQEQHNAETLEKMRATGQLAEDVFSPVWLFELEPMKVPFGRNFAFHFSKWFSGIVLKE